MICRVEFVKNCRNLYGLTLFPIVFLQKTLTPIDFDGSRKQKSILTGVRGRNTFYVMAGVRAEPIPLQTGPTLLTYGVNERGGMVSIFLVLEGRNFSQKGLKWVV